MQFHQTFHELRARESAGQLRGINAGTAAIAIALATAVAAYQRAFHGPIWAEEHKRATEARRTAEANEMAGQIQEALLSAWCSDVREVAQRVTEAASTDFAIVLEQTRARVVRERYTPVTDTELMMMVGTPRIVGDFKPIRGVRWSGFDELLKQPEGTNVEYAEIGYTTDLYAVAKYALATRLTYELIKNDEVGLFVNQLAALGDAGRRTRSKIVLRALDAGLTAAAFGGGVGGPTIERIDDLISTGFAAETITNEDGSTVEMGTTPTDIFVPIKWQTLLQTSLNSQYAPSASTTTRNAQANPVYGAATGHADRMMSTIFGSDWIAWDRNAPAVVEQAILDDFQGGPRTLTQMPDVIEAQNLGDFMKCEQSVKCMDATAAKVVSTKGVRRIDGV